MRLDLFNNMGIKLDEFLTKESELDIDLSKYPSGIYYINFDSSNSIKGCIEEKKQVVTNKIILNK